MVAALHDAGLGLIVDIVPNHMAVGPENAWWQDVLRHGRASVHGDVFDIDWHPDNPLLDGKLLLPVLGKPYGEALESGEIVVAGEATGPAARYFDQVFPIRPEDVAEIAALGPGAYDPHEAAGRARLHRLLERQHWRLAFWRTAGDEINWRRFFDIHDLAGVRVELPRVFEATHATLFRLYAEGLIDGMRVDHVDGLSDPGGYCRRLRERLTELARARPPGIPEGAYLVVEKILGRGESLPEDWAVNGTSGYDFMDAVSAVQHDAQAAPVLSALWAALSGRSAEFAAEEVAARREILERGFAAQLEAVVGALHRVALRLPTTRDISRPAIRRALGALLAHFPAYRPYARSADVPAQDAVLFARALAGAKAERPARPEVLPLVAEWLRAPVDAARLVAATRFQQLSAPIAAKAVEDTAFYRYGRLLSRNDVGFDAARLGAEPAAFHAQAAARLAAFPDAMLATATHDHKRGEDVRARLAVLSECAEEWGATLRGWMARNVRHRRDADAPSAGDEVMLYQMIVGAWPMTLAPSDADGRRAFAERLAGWQAKALHEAKLRTSWVAPDAKYETAARDFLDAAMSDDAFADEIAAFVGRIAAAGALNGLAQAVLKLTTPGVPDFYQGTEFWDQSLVDPDNRAAVDWAARAAALEAARTPAELAADWRDGRVKQAVIARILALRRRLPHLFARGDYIPVHAEGARARHVLGFLRRTDEAALLVIVPRLPFGLRRDLTSVQIPAANWADTTMMLPSAGGSVALRDVLGGGEVRGARVEIATVLMNFPIAVLSGSSRLDDHRSGF